MKYSATVTVQYDTPFSLFPASEYYEAFDWLAENEFDGAEICISNYNHIDIYKIKDELNTRALGCSTISTGQARTLENISLLSGSKDVVAKAQERMKQHVDAASVLGCKVTLGLLRGLGTPNKEEEEKRLLAENLLPLVEYATKKDVRIVLEAINRYETRLLNTVEEAKDFIENYLGNPGSVGVLMDIFHANIEEVSFSRAIDSLGNKLMHVHVADSNRRFPGYGHVDFAEIVKKLKSVDYAGYLSFECLNLPSTEVVRNESGSFIHAMRELEK